MPGQFFRKAQLDFSATDTIVFTHNAGDENLCVQVLVGGELRLDLISSVVPDLVDPRNKLTVTLKSVQSGSVQLVSADVYPVNLPTSYESAKVTAGVTKYRMGFPLIDKTNKPYLKFDDDSYTTAVVFPFPGTDVGARPDTFTVTVRMKDVDDVNVTFRIVDINNPVPASSIVAQATVVPDEDIGCYSLGTVSNLPAGPTVFELQVLVAEDDDLYVYFLEIFEA